MKIFFINFKLRPVKMFAGYGLLDAVLNVFF